MPTLTDRYVWAVLRALPPEHRDTVEQELRANIADAIDADDDDDRLSSEKRAIREMGDPSQLAVGFSPKPSYLIGPTNYVQYRHVLGVIVSVVCFAAALGAFLVSNSYSTPPGVVLASVALAVVISGLLGLVGVTASYAAIDRRSVNSAPFGPEATLHRLPHRPPPRASSSTSTILMVLGALTAFVVILVGELITQDFANPNEAVFLLPQGAEVATITYFALIAIAFGAIYVGVYRSDGWTTRLAWLNTLLNIVFVVPTAWMLFTGAVIVWNDGSRNADEIGVITLTPAALLGWILLIAGVVDSLGSHLAAYRRQRNNPPLLTLVADLFGRSTAGKP